MNHPHLESLFVKKLDIKTNYTLDIFVHPLISILNQKKPSSLSQISFIQQIYKDISSKYKERPNSFHGSKFWELVKSHPLILTQTKGFLKMGDNIFYNDANELYQIFKNQENIAFINVPKADIPILEDFFKMTKTRSISSSSTVVITNEKKGLERMDLTELIQTAVPYILRFIYHNDPDLYKKTALKKKLSQLQSLKIIEMAQLEVEVKITDIGNNKSEIAEQTNLRKLYHNNKIFITEGDPQYKDYIGLLLSSYFLDDMKGADDFIANILYKIENSSEDTTLSAFLEDKKIYPLPRAEKPTLSLYFNQQDIKILFEEHPIQTQTSKQMTTHQRLKLPDIETTRIFKDGQNTIAIDQKKRKIGMLGEELVFEILVRQLKERYPNSEVVQETEKILKIQSKSKTNKTAKKVSIYWNSYDENQAAEGYDILLSENGKKTFIEVKSSGAIDKRTFEISKQEWALAKRKGDSYHIYRVLGLTSNSPQINVIPNPYQRWVDGEIGAHSIELRNNIHNNTIPLDQEQFLVKGKKVKLNYFQMKGELN